jgi:hypothetical protein
VLPLVVVRVLRVRVINHHGGDFFFGVCIIYIFEHLAGAELQMPGVICYLLDIKISLL